MNNRFNKAKIVQDYFTHYANANTLDTEFQEASNVFGGAILYATNVFINRLILGGAYTTNQEDKMIIMDSLKTITKILEKYEISNN